MMNIGSKTLTGIVFKSGGSYGSTDIGSIGLNLIKIGWFCFHVFHVKKRKLDPGQGRIGHLPIPRVHLRLEIRWCLKI